MHFMCCWWKLREKGLFSSLATSFPWYGCVLCDITEPTERLCNVRMPRGPQEEGGLDFLIHLLHKDGRIHTVWKGTALLTSCMGCGIPEKILQARQECLADVYSMPCGREPFGEGQHKTPHDRMRFRILVSNRTQQKGRQLA